MLTVESSGAYLPAPSTLFTSSVNSSPLSALMNSLVFPSATSQTRINLLPPPPLLASPVYYIAFMIMSVK
jgi:hypothetical protein